MTFIESLIETILSRRDQLISEIRGLEDAQRALDNGLATPPQKVESNGAQSKPRRRRQKPRRSTQVLLAEQLEGILGESNDGLSTAAIAEQGNAEASQVLTLLRELEKSGQVRRTGERRGTRWHPITEEDRIAERAAELASRSTS